MSRATLAQLATIVGGRLHGADAAFESVSIDSRTLRGGELFVALRGPNFDGNAFVDAAAAAGAAGALVERPTLDKLGQVVVSDTLQALGRFANHWRRRFSPVLVAVTGSNGKTTVKEMIASILRRVGTTLATHGNLNNEIGVPLTLLRLKREHQFAVIEMGANHAGEIARLTAMAAPNIGLITNAAAAHLEGFGSLAGVARAKGELFEGLARKASAVINRDDTYHDVWRSMSRAREVVTFGQATSADFFVAASQKLSNGHGDGLSLQLDTPDGRVAVTLRLAGQHNAINAAAAAAAAWSAGADLEQIAQGLAAVEPVRGRLAMRRAQSGAKVIDDTYNANPSSVQAALDLLAAQPGATWLVLGDMGELGDDSRALHAHIGERARLAGVERLFTVGSMSVAAAESFGSGAQSFESTAELIDALRGDLRKDVTVLIKASRAMRLERVSDALSDEGDQ